MVRANFLFRAHFAYFRSHASLLAFCSSYFIVAVPMCECLGKHSLVSYKFPVAILNCTFLVYDSTTTNAHKEFGARS